ncbi:MAG: RNA polymerase sigma factor [Longimicrobiales bacterium]
MKEASPKGLLPDDTLVDRARSGDPEAMDELVRRHHASAFRVAVGILRDEDAAADVAQDAFLKAFKGLDGFRGDAAFRTWLLTITANEARGFLRKLGRRRETALEAVGPLASDQATVEDSLERDQEAERVKALLAHLPEKQRQAVTLRIFEGLSFKEVGVVIGSSEGAARVNYHHAVRKLKEMLA